MSNLYRWRLEPLKLRGAMANGAYLDFIQADPGEPFSATLWNGNGEPVTIQGIRPDALLAFLEGCASELRQAQETDAITYLPEAEDEACSDCGRTPEENAVDENACTECATEVDSPKSITLDGQPSALLVTPLLGGEYVVGIAIPADVAEGDEGRVTRAMIHALREMASMMDAESPYEGTD